MVTYGSKLRAIRALFGLTQEQVAEKAPMKLERRDIIKFEQDIALPTDATKRALHTALGLDLEAPEIEAAFEALTTKSPSVQMRANGAVELIPIGN